MPNYFYNGRSLTEGELDAVLDADRKTHASDDRLQKTARLIQGKRVLEVGCAGGIIINYFARMHPDWKFTGTDILSESIRIANEKHKLPNTVFETRDLLKKRFPKNSFDCILFLEVIEHVSNPGEFLKEFHNILSPGGCLIISTPNAVSSQNIARHFGQNISSRVKQIMSEPANTGTHLDHVAAYDVFTLTRLLERSGFSYKEHKYARFTLPLSRSKWVSLDFLSNVLKPLSDDLIVKAVKRS